MLESRYFPARTNGPAGLLVESLLYSAPSRGWGFGMPELREKTISYRRAEWFGGAGVTLQKCVHDALHKLKSVEQRTIIHGDQYVRCAKTRDHANGGLLVHLTAETPGESASIVPKVAATITELDLKTERPPTGGEYLDGDAFLFMKGDHVCLCTTSIRDGAVRAYLVDLFLKASLSKNTTKFDLMKVADIKKVKLLKKDGVKELEIRATLYKATADYHNRKNQVIGWTGAIGKTMKAFLGKPHDVTPDGLRVALTLKTDQRFGSRAVAIGETEIETLAADVVTNLKRDPEDKHPTYDYVIKTGKGQRITLDEIFMKTRVAIATDGKTVQCDKTWKELVKFFNALEEAGALEE